MSKFTYEEFLEKGYMELEISHYLLGLKEKSILLEKAKEYIEESNDLYFFNFVKFERIAYWYWLITYTDFESLVDFKISDLSVEQQDEMIWELGDKDIYLHDFEFMQRTMDTMTSLANSMNVAKIIREERDEDMNSIKDMFRGLENMQTELDLMSSTIEEFNKSIGG